jgi:tetratricopeptide (TPR) repeat protein
MATLYNQTRQHEKAMQIVRSRGFQPWEGGEGLALGQHVRTHVALGRLVLAEGDAKGAVRLFQMALDAPNNLGEAKHPLANQSDIHYWLGTALHAAGDPQGSRRSWEIAARHRGDFQQMRVTSFSELTLYSALAMMRLGRIEEAKQLLGRMLAFAEALMNEETKIDYFATSLPTMLLFDDDAKKTQHCDFTFPASAGMVRPRRRRKITRATESRPGTRPQPCAGCRPDGATRNAICDCQG